MTIKDSPSSHAAPSPQIVQAQVQASAAAASHNTPHAGGAAPIPQLQRHQLAAPAIGVPDYQTVLRNDELGIVSEYLEQPEQLAIRTLGTLKTVIDPKVTSLTMPAREAAEMLAAPHNFSHLRALRLTHCDDMALCHVAASLGRLPDATLARLELILEQSNSAEISAQGLHAIAPLRLSGISLKGIMLLAADAQALWSCRSPVSIWLADDRPTWSSLPAICGIPTLALLHAPSYKLSDETVVALRENASLKHLSVGKLTSAAVCLLTESTSLQTLSVNEISDNEAAVFTALANNRVLTSVTIEHVERAQSLAILSTNPLLISVALGLDKQACDGIPNLVNMPALRALSLFSRQVGGTLRQADVQALCARPLASLQLRGWHLDPTALPRIVAAQARNLALDDCYPFSDAAINRLAANRWVTSLSLQGGMISVDHALRLTNSRSLTSLRVEFIDDAAKASAALLQAAWGALNKPLANLQVTVPEQYEDDGQDDEAHPMDTE